SSALRRVCRFHPTEFATRRSLVMRRRGLRGAGGEPMIACESALRSSSHSTVRLPPHASPAPDFRAPRERLRLAPDRRAHFCVFPLASWGNVFETMALLG